MNMHDSQKNADVFAAPWLPLSVGAFGSGIHSCVVGSSQCLVAADLGRSLEA
jgi:hypothetical protein